MGGSRWRTVSAMGGERPAGCLAGTKEGLKGPAKKCLPRPCRQENGLQGRCEKGVRGPNGDLAYSDPRKIKPAVKACSTKLSNLQTRLRKRKGGGNTKRSVDYHGLEERMYGNASGGLPPLKASTGTKKKGSGIRRGILKGTKNVQKEDWPCYASTGLDPGKQHQQNPNRKGQTGKKQAGPGSRNRRQIEKGPETRQPVIR